MARKKRSNVSAGLLLFRSAHSGLEVFLAHPGGPLWEARDLGAWTVPKGLLEEGEDPLVAAIRHPDELLVTRVAFIGFNAVAAVGVHN